MFIEEAEIKLENGMLQYDDDDGDEDDDDGMN